MHEIHFTEEQLKDPQLIGSILFAEDPSDPRSWNYERKLVRPKICWMKILFSILLFSLGVLGLYFALAALSPRLAFWACLICGVATILVFLKRILICLIRVYQKLAPAALRNKCRFEPSCSQYMILALQKHGLWKGLSMGIHRLKRCNTDGGGFDYP